MTRFGTSPAARAVRIVGVFVFAATLFLPAHACGPGAYPLGSGPRAAAERPDAPVEVATQVPIEEIVRRGSAGYAEGGVGEALWRTRVWYPYLLLPLWLAALAMAAAGGRGARAAGWGMLGLSVGLAVFEGAYLWRNYRGALPENLRIVEVGLIGLGIVAILFVRRGRPVLDPGAAISAQALLCFLHALTFPAYDLGRWVDAGAPASSLASALLHDYRPGFWLALVGLALAAGPAYVRSLPAFPVPARRSLDAPPVSA